MLIDLLLMILFAAAGIVTVELQCMRTPTYLLSVDPSRFYRYQVPFAVDEHNACSFRVVLQLKYVVC